MSGPAETVGKNDEAVCGYSDFAIVSPLTIMLKIDGEDGAQLKAGDDIAIELTNLSRDRHTVEAVVLHAQGNALIRRVCRL